MYMEQLYMKRDLGGKKSLKLDIKKVWICVFSACGSIFIYVGLFLYI